MISAAIVTANAWGLFLVIVLLGYGLVEIPKRMWRRTNPTLLLKYYQFEVVNKKDEIEAAKKELHETLKVVKLYSEKVRSSDPYSEYLDIILAAVTLPLTFISLTLITVPRRVRSDYFRRRRI